MIKSFGTLPTGEWASLYTISCGNISAQITDFGATLVRLNVPDARGNIADVVLGYEDVNEYATRSGHLGAAVGRNANRIGGAAFPLNGKTVQLGVNHFKNNLHSGPNFFDLRMWQVETYEQDRIVLRLGSPDGDQGFPGNATVTVRYSITDENGIRIEYDACSDKDTVFNMTNHTYFNLDGEDSDSLKDHILQIDSDHITEDRDDGVPTGGIVSVKDTLYDFNVPSDLANRLGSDELSNGGYDNTYLLKGEGFRKVAYLESKKAGISLDVYTDMPAMVLYTANTLSETGRNGIHHGPLSSICLETQYVPGSIDKGDFDRCVFKAGEHFHSVTEYRFRDTYPDIEW